MLPAIVFIHGFKGSMLRDCASGKNRWVTAPAALWGSHTLALQPSGVAIDGVLDLCVSGVLLRVPVIPGLISYPVYGPWLSALTRAVAGRAQVVPFAYDWRRDNLEAVSALAALVGALRGRGVPAIHLVAHSMGGLIAAYFLRYGSQALETAVENWAGAAALDRVVIGGTPYRGAMKAFHDMVYGAVTVRNGTLLGPVAMGSMPAAYQLLPWPGHDKVLSESWSPEPQAIYRAEHWRQGGWGLLRHGGELPADERAARLTYVASQLERTRRWFALLHAPFSACPSGRNALLNIRGCGHPTPDRALWIRGEQGSVIFDHRRLRERFAERIPRHGSGLLEADGDETVTSESAALPAAYEQALSTSNLDARVVHGGLYSDRGVQRAVLDFLRL